MFLMSGAVAVLVLLKFALGFIIGAGTATLIYQSRLTRARVLRASLAGGVVFVLMSGVAGWAGSHAALEGDHRLDTAPWGEDLRLRNAIAENEFLLCVTASIGVAALATVGTPDQER